MDSQMRSIKQQYFLLFHLFLRGVLGIETVSPQARISTTVTQTFPDGDNTTSLISGVLDSSNSTEAEVSSQVGVPKNPPLQYQTSSKAASFTGSYSGVDDSDVEEPVTEAPLEEISSDGRNTTISPFPFDSRKEQDDTMSSNFTMSPLAAGESTVTLLNGTSLPFNLPRKFCTGKFVVQTAGCFCDNFCGLFQDCCSNDYCKKRSSSVGMRLSSNNIECVLQSTSFFSGLNPQHFWMVTSCPDEWPHDTVRSKCEGPRNTSDVDRIVPVSDLATNLTFHNEHCAMCHGISDFQQWGFYFTCHKSLSFDIDSFFNIIDEDDFMEQGRSKDGCSLFFTPPVDIPGRPCIPSDFMPIVSVSGIGIRAVQCYPELEELCWTGPISVTHIQWWSWHFYARNAFCWLCRWPSNLLTHIRNCTVSVSSQSFDPLGFTVQIDTSGARYKKPCERSRDQALCNEEEDQCFTPIRYLVNIDFNIQMALMSEHEQKASAAEGICEVGIAYLFYAKIYKAIGNGTWRFIPDRNTCTQMSRNATNQSLVAVSNFQVRLTKMVRGYREGSKLFASYRAEFSRTLKARKETVYFNAQEYLVILLDSDAGRCPLPMEVHDGKNDTASSCARGGLRGDALVHAVFAIFSGILACGCLIYRFDRNVVLG